MNERKMNILVEIISTLFILLFVYAAASKIIDFQKFQIELGKSPMLSFTSTYVAVIIPTLEIVISIFLTSKKFQYFALYACFSLMIMFSCYIILILKFSPYIPCTCGGILENMSWLQHLIFNIGFIIIGVVGVLSYPKRTYLQ